MENYFFVKSFENLIFIYFKILIQDLSNIIMGTVLAKLIEHRSDLMIGIGILSIISYIVYQRRQNLKFKQQLAKNNIKLDDQKKQGNAIYKIAITGGPCAGKSTSMEKVAKQFKQKGYRVFTVPEVPTMVVLSGGMILMSQFNAQERIKFQSLLIRFQMYVEDYITKLANMSKMPSIVLCDRGTMDPEAYISKEQFQSILDQEGWSKVVLRDRRYDRVIFLSSAANGAQKFYTLQNNVARSEGIQVARQLDKKTLQAWVGHPHLTIVPNKLGQTFDDKINRVVRSVQKTVGIEMKGAHQAKILIEKPQYPVGLHVQRGQRTDIQLLNDDPSLDQVKITQWGQNKSYCYQYKTRAKRQSVGDFSQQVRRPLTSVQFMQLRQNADPHAQSMHYDRTKFATNNIYYTIDTLNTDTENQINLLRFYCKKQQTMNLIPDFIKVIRDVAKEKQFTNKYLSKKK